MTRFIIRRLIETPFVLLTVLAVVFVCLLATTSAATSCPGTYVATTPDGKLVSNEAASAGPPKRTEAMATEARNMLFSQRRRRPPSTSHFGSARRGAQTAQTRRSYRLWTLFPIGTIPLPIDWRALCSAARAEHD